MPVIHSTSLETKRLLHIGLPLVAAYASEFAMFVTTKMVVGQLGYLELAAAGISGGLSLELNVILIGLLSIVGVLCAQAVGAGKNHEVGFIVKQGFIISLLIGIPATWVVWNFDMVLVWTGQDSTVVELSIPYLRHLSGFMLPLLFFSVLRNFVSALSRPHMVMTIAALAVGVNYLLTMWLVHGGWGVPAMGLAGAGLATSIVSWLMFLGLLFLIYRTRDLRGYGLFQRGWKIDLSYCSEIMRLGLPVAALVFLEAGLFTASSILSGIISAETLAAYEVVLAWIGLPFVIALGIAEATMIRVAHGVGSRQFFDARRSGMVGMGIGVGLLILLILLPIGFPTYIIGFFIQESSPGFSIVSQLAINFLWIGAIFQVFDGLQAIAARTLRSYKDNFVPLWIATFGYWILGIGGGSVMAFWLNMGGAGLWWGLAIGLTTTGSLLAWRFHRLSLRYLSVDESGDS